MAKVIAESSDSALTSKCQATIPKSIREYLKVGPGDRLRFFVHPDGHVAVLPLRPLREAAGILKPAVKRRRTLEEIEHGIAARATSRFRGK